MKISLGQLRRIITEALFKGPFPMNAKVAIAGVLAKHPNHDPEGVDVWPGANGKIILEIPDDDLRAVVRYEWDGTEWKQWDFEPYYE